MPEKKKAAEAGRIARATLKVIAGASLSSPKDLVKLAAHAGDQLLKREFSQALFDTYNFFMNKSEIDPKYFSSRSFADLAPEFGRIQKEAYGTDKLNTLRRVFANLAKDNGRDSYKKYLLDIALDMSEIEIKVLVADALLARDTKDQQASNKLRSASNWLSEIASVSGLKHRTLIETAEKGLTEKGLLGGRLRGDLSGTDFTMEQGRLTSTGSELHSLMQLDDDPVNQ